MKILSLDTTSMLGSFALSDGDKLVVQEQQHTPETHSARLLSSVEKLLDEASWRKDELDALAVAIGPGSFTGLRIGLAAAKGMALSLSLPIAGESSLKSLALNGLGSEKIVVSLIDARRGELYAFASRVKSKGEIETVIDECVLPPDVLIEKLKALGEELFIVGDGLIAYRKIIEGALGDSLELPGEELLLPRAHNLALLAGDRLKNGGDDLAMLIPNYLRQSDAEIGFLGRSKVKNK